MDIQEIKRNIIKTVEETNDEHLLHVLQEDIMEYKTESSESIGQILGGVDWDELKAQVEDKDEEEYTFEEMMKNIGRWQK